MKATSDLRVSQDSMGSFKPWGLLNLHPSHLGQSLRVFLRQATALVPLGFPGQNRAFLPLLSSCPHWHGCISVSPSKPCTAPGLHVCSFICVPGRPPVPAASSAQKTRFRNTPVGMGATPSSWNSGSQSASEVLSPSLIPSLGCVRLFQAAP